MRISINAISGRPEYGAIVWICNDGVLQDKEGRENLRQLRHFNSNLHGTWKEEKKGGRQGAGRDGVPPPPLLHLWQHKWTSVVSTGLFLPKERIIENQGESQGSSNLWNGTKKKKSFVICMETGLGKFYIKLFIICGIRVWGQPAVRDHLKKGEDMMLRKDTDYRAK